MTFEMVTTIPVGTLYLTLERSYQAALIAVYEANIGGDERNQAIQDLRGRLAGVMDTAPIREFITYCNSIASKYRH